MDAVKNNMSEKELLLELKGISFGFPEKEPLYLQTGLSLCKGQNLGFWSPNGSGKTTLFKIITGLIQPQEGEIFLKGKPISSESDFRELRLKVGFVLQHSDDQLFFPEVIDDVSFGPLNLGFSEEEALSASINALERLGISSLAHSLSFELSGGQKKLVTLAAVLSMNPEILLLDEPSNGLDEKSRHLLISQINSLDCAKIIISHEPELLIETCDSFITIQEKKIVPVPAPTIHEHRHAHFFGGTAHTHGS